jgi:hypothetical protein
MSPARGTYEVGCQGHKPQAWLHFAEGDPDDTRNARSAALDYARNQSAQIPGTTWTVTRELRGDRAVVARYRSGTTVT